MLTLGLLGVDLRLAGVGLQPVAEGGGAGVVDDPDLGAHGQGLGDALARPLDGERDQVRVEAGLGEHLTGDLHGEREREHRARVRLDQDRVAGGEGGEQARVAVPRGEGVAADHQGDAAADRGELLAQLQGVALALRLGPVGPPGGGAGLLRVRVRHGLQAAVLGVRAHAAWNAIMNAWPLVCMTAWANSWVRAEIRARISRQTRARVSAPASRQAPVPARIAGSRTSMSACGYSMPSAGLVRRGLAARPAVRAGLVELEAGVQQGLVGGETGRRVERAVLPVRLRVLGVRRPVGTGPDGVERLVESGPVLLGQTVDGLQGGGHGWTNSSSSWAGRHVRS